MRTVFILTFCLFISITFCSDSQEDPDYWRNELYFEMGRSNNTSSNNTMSNNTMSNNTMSNNTMSNNTMSNNTMMTNNTSSSNATSSNDTTDPRLLIRANPFDKALWYKKWAEKELLQGIKPPGSLGQDPPPPAILSPHEGKPDFCFEDRIVMVKGPDVDCRPRWFLSTDSGNCELCPCCGDTESVFLTKKRCEEACEPTPASLCLTYGGRMGTILVGRPGC